jgi:hypothetical protein
MEMPTTRITTQKIRKEFIADDLNVTALVASSPGVVRPAGPQDWTTCGVRTQNPEALLAPPGPRRERSWSRVRRSLTL